jgi:acetamidase/formamidase
VHGRRPRPHAGRPRRDPGDHIVETYGHTRRQAYAIASVAADLRIHEIVDAPNWVIGAFLPEAIFTAGH